MFPIIFLSCQSIQTSQNSSVTWRDRGIIAKYLGRRKVTSYSNISLMFSLLFCKLPIDGVNWDRIVTKHPPSNVKISSICLTKNKERKACIQMKNARAACRACWACRAVRNNCFSWLNMQICGILSSFLPLSEEFAYLPIFLLLVFHIYWMHLVQIRQSQIGEKL